MSTHIFFQEQTPKEWITRGNYMFRLKSWELSYEQVYEAIENILGKESIFELKLPYDPESNYSHVLVQTNEDMEKLRTTVIKYKDSLIKKIPQFKIPIDENYRTIFCKEVPSWITEEMILNKFSKYNTDPSRYTVKIDNKMLDGIKYPIIRLLKVNDDINKVYIEYSPHKSSIHDGLVASFMTNNILFTNTDGSKILLRFKIWIKNYKLNFKLI